MHRRALLSSLAAVGAAATAGCAGYRLTVPVERRRFSICDGDCGWTDRTPEAGGDPVVVREPGRNRIVVYGHVYVGSSSCDKAVLESLSVSGDTLRVVVGVGDRGLLPSVACTGDVSADRYRLVVVFRDSLPDAVRVEQRGVYNPGSTAVGTESGAGDAETPTDRDATDGGDAETPTDADAG